MVTKTSLFVEHPVIKPLANYQRWTITEPTTKRPLDIPWMIATFPNVEIRGCDYRLPDTMMTLSDLIETLTTMGTEPVNFAYYLTPDLDDIIVVDVEPSASKEVKEAFLSTPFLYGETSLSGNGFHLVYKRPEPLFKQYPISQMKSRLRSADTTFEILIDHWVTFTGNQIKPPAIPQYTLESLVEPLFANASEPSTEATLPIAEIAPDSVEELYDKFAPIILKQAATGAKSFEECNSDMSLYELEFVEYLMLQFNQIVKAYNRGQTEPYIPTDDEVVYFSAMLAEEMLEWRDKHERLFGAGHKWLIQKAIEGLAWYQTSPDWKWTY